MANYNTPTFGCDFFGSLKRILYINAQNKIKCNFASNYFMTPNLLHKHLQYVFLSLRLILFVFLEHLKSLKLPILKCRNT